VSRDDLPEAVRGLLDQRIDSLEQLTILLLLRQESDRSWTAAAVGEHLRRPPEVTAALGALQAAGLVRAVTAESQPSYIYSPASPELDEAVTELARRYREHPITIIRILSANSIRRLRAGAARAFVLPKEEDNTD